MKLETKVGLFIITAISIFVYLSINIRAFRFDKDQFYLYKAYFDDTGGLSAKASIRIAGVEVGWVESVRLMPGGKAELELKIHGKNKLSKNAYAMIHQDGLIGTKSVEIDPGDPTTGFLLPGSALSMPGKTPTSVGELLDQFRGIASSIQDITNSIKSVFETRRSENEMKQALHSIAQASERMSDFSLILKQTMEKNQNNIDSIISDLKDAARNVPNSITTNANKIGTRIDETGKVVSTTFGHVDEVAVLAKDTFRETGQVMEKINTGKGVVGKLINEDETYGDLKKTIGGFKEFVTKTQSLMLNVDMHTESMVRHTNSKGYLELRLRPYSDYFYVLQLVGDEQGSVSREVEYITRRDDKGNILRASDHDIPIERKIEFADQIEREIRKKNDVLFGLQFGKRFDRLAFRVGMFESTFGMGLDFYVPLKTDKVHWVTTVEAFDFRGTNRIDDNRPHVKWLNRAFFLKNIYTTFGVDDIYSKRNANPFFGGGIRFGDDDLKYFFSSMMPIARKTS